MHKEFEKYRAMMKVSDTMHDRVHIGLSKMVTGSAENLIGEQMKQYGRRNNLSQIGNQHHTPKIRTWWSLIARSIKANAASIHTERETYYVGAGGFDTHFSATSELEDRLDMLTMHFQHSSS
jgi:hypothetical protein